MRKLASIQEICWIAPIEGKDRIELAGVLGWQVIVVKGEYKVGDKVIFVEIDSVLPERPEFEFLRSKKFRIKTLKMSGVVSQGICFPLSILPKKNYSIDDDVTDLLGITQYIPTQDREPELQGKAKKPRSKLLKFLFRFKIFRMLLMTRKEQRKSFPDFISKTDEVRCLEGKTKIETDSGSVEISKITNSTTPYKIKSYNLETKEFEYKEIIGRQRIIEESHLYEIEYFHKGNTNRKNRILCTGDHSFFINGEYIKAKDLKTGGIISGIDYSYPPAILPIVYGMILGDTHICFEKRLTVNNLRNNNCKLSFCQGYKQYKYLKFKQQVFGKDTFPIRKGKSGYCDNIIYQGSLKSDKTISNALNSLCIKNRKFHVTKEFAENLTPVSLAFWYMDDGTIKHKATDDCASPTIMISSNSLSKEENQILVDVLNNKFNIECNLRKDKKYYGIYITVKGTPLFLKMISKYIHPSMRYKTLQELENCPFEIENLKFEKDYRLMDIKISNINKIKVKNKVVHDITVKDNHNFLANGILTHNCQNIPHILNNKDIKYVVTEKVDGSSLTIFLKKINRKKFDFGVCSRNLRLFDDDKGNYWRAVRKYDLENVLHKLIGDNEFVAIQGEVIAPNIQGNKYKVSEPDFYAFNLIYPEGRVDSITGAETLKQYGVKWVPIIDTNFTLLDTVNDMLAYSDGKSAIANTDREGFVIRSLDGKQSFKVVSPKFLLKNDE